MKWGESLGFSFSICFIILFSVLLLVDAPELVLLFLKTREQWLWIGGKKLFFYLKQSCMSWVESLWMAKILPFEF